MNVGAFLAPLVCGTLGEIYGWHYGFGAAGVGMLAGLVIYLAGQRYLPAEQDAGASSCRTMRRAPRRQRARHVPAAARHRPCRDRFPRRLRAGRQHGRAVDRRASTAHVGSVEIPMTWFQSLNPLLVIVMTPDPARAVEAAGRRGTRASPLQKMATGALIVGGSYLLLAAAEAQSGGGSALVVAAWLFLRSSRSASCTSCRPGSGLFARLAPPKLGATTVAAWYLAIFAGSLTAGFVGVLVQQLSARGLLPAPRRHGLARRSAAALLDRRARASRQRAVIAERSALAAVPEGLAGQMSDLCADQIRGLSARRRAPCPGQSARHQPEGRNQE